MLSVALYVGLCCGIGVINPSSTVSTEGFAATASSETRMGSDGVRRPQEARTRHIPKITDLFMSISLILVQKSAIKMESRLNITGSERIVLFLFEIADKWQIQLGKLTVKKWPL